MLDLSAYGQAVIHLAWYRNYKIYHVLFGMVELRPSELPRAPGCCMKSFRVGSRGRKYVYYKRFAVSVSPEFPRRHGRLDVSSEDRTARWTLFP